MTPPRLGSIEALRALWDDETSSAGKRSVWAAAAFGIVLATIVGRMGYDWSRAAAAALVLVFFIPAIVRNRVLARRRSDPRAVMNATIARVDRATAEAALRALTLSHDTSHDPRRGSLELARLHFARVLGRASLHDVSTVAQTLALRTTVLSLLLAAGAFGIVIADPFRIIEGLDVLAARDGVAPVAVEWVENPRVTAEPPAYLDMSREPIHPHRPASLPAGTTLTVSATPLRSGRALVLTDGVDEIAFHEDGEGALVARWTVTGDVSLSVAARFGDVLVPEPVPLEIHAIPDFAPYVRLDGAPATIRLLDQPRIPIHWQATDDHGLREVALVLRAGEHEVRRELSKLQGGGTMDKGGIELAAEDPFLQKSYVPIEVTVQALDNDPVTGQKWGVSAPLILVPPEIGEREAMRYRALLEARQLVTDVVAARVELDPPLATERADAVSRERKRHEEMVRALLALADRDFGGLRMSGRTVALIRGQLESIAKEIVALEGGDLGIRWAALVERSENALLTIDSALNFIGTLDTRRSAIKLSDVAADAAAAIGESREPEQQDRAVRRLNADLDVLAGSALHLLALGTLGADIGEIVQNDLRRIHRAWDAGDRYHARLAAEDLAARLRNPDPSFGSAGGHGHGGGVEAGGSGQQSEGEASQAAEQAAGVDDALEQLRQEHAQQMQEVAQAMKDAMSPEQREQLAEQMRQAAKEVRDAVKDLPQQGAAPGSPRSSAAAARSEAESAASAMERGDMDQAMEQGQRALDSLRQAEQSGGEAPEGSSEQSIGQAAGNARQRMQEVLDQAKRQLDESQQRSSQNASQQLQKLAKREKELAERARDVRRQSLDSEAPLPEEMLDRLREAADSMDDAAEKLDGGKGSEGQQAQEKAQRLLEMSQPESEEQAERANDPGEGPSFDQNADVPEESRDERADSFRKRATQGLGRKSPPHLRDALRRYTESLLR